MHYVLIYTSAVIRNVSSVVNGHQSFKQTFYFDLHYANSVPYSEDEENKSSKRLQPNMKLLGNLSRIPEIQCSLPSGPRIS
jgi:hypothetical protein